MIGPVVLCVLLAMRLNPDTTLQMAAMSPFLSALDAPVTALGAATASWLFVGYGLAPAAPKLPS